MAALHPLSTPILAALLLGIAATAQAGTTLLARSEAGAPQTRGQAQQDSRTHDGDGGKNDMDRKNLPSDKRSDDRQRAGQTPGQDKDRANQGGSDSRGTQGEEGATTGSTGHGGLPGSGASSGSGGTADQR